MKKNNPALKPCPFCSGEAHLFHGKDYESVECCNCGAKVFVHDIGEEAQCDAMSQWNNRPIVSVDSVMKNKETVTLEKRVYDVVLKNNARLMGENENLRGALEAILEATQKENVSIPALRFVAYTALKDAEKCK